MPAIEELTPFLAEPREDLGAEYKGWLDFRTNEHRATLAKSAIALANHGGGYIIIGMDEGGQAFVSQPKPDEYPDIEQDMVNAAIRRYASPEFHCEVYNVNHPETNNPHPIVSVPGTVTEPVMAVRDCEGVIAQHRCYTRKPGPRSEEPHTADEWRKIISRCVRANRDDLLESFRVVMTGHVADPPVPNVQDELLAFSEGGRAKWQELVADLPENSAARFPHGHYEMSFSIIGAVPIESLADLAQSLRVARQIKHTGWTPFLEMNRPEWRPTPYDDGVEAWIGYPVPDRWGGDNPSHCDYWRVSRNALMFTMRGYSEDGTERAEPGQLLDVTLPVWRVGEAILFARRFADEFEGATGIAISTRFVGLRGRVLTSMDGRRAIFDGRSCNVEEITLAGQASLAQIDDNLVELMHSYLAPLYELFSFFRLPIELVEQELARMRENRH